MLSQLVLNRSVESLRIRCLIIQLNSAQSQAAVTHYRRIERDSGHSILQCSGSPVGVFDWRDRGNAAIGSVGQSHFKLERIVVAETWVSTAVFESAIKNAEAASNHPLVV